MSFELCPLPFLSQPSAMKIPIQAAEARNIGLHLLPGPTQGWGISISHSVTQLPATEAKFLMGAAKRQRLPSSVQLPLVKSRC